MSEKNTNEEVRVCRLVREAECQVSYENNYYDYTPYEYWYKVAQYINDSDLDFILLFPCSKARLLGMKELKEACSIVLLERRLLKS